MELEEKKKDGKSLMTKILQPQKIKKATWQQKKRHQQTSITQRLQTKLGRLVGVMTVTQLVRLNRLTGSQPFQ